MVEEDQDRILEEHIQVVREQAFFMKNCLDKNNLRDALKYSSTMLGEMKTSRLSPRNYFNLCKYRTWPRYTWCDRLEETETRFFFCFKFLTIGPVSRHDGV